MELEEIIKYSADARTALKAGIGKVARAVGSTMGPCGQNVIIGKSNKKPQITKDGITVARAIELIDPIEHMGAQIVIQGAESTVEEVGDGTTTCTVLTHALIQAIPDDLLPYRQDLVNDFNQLEKIIYDYIDEIKIKDDKYIYQAALISCNNDVELADAIYSLVKDNDSAEIEVKLWDQNYIKAEKLNGYSYNKGYSSVHFINNDKNAEVLINNPKVILVDGKVEDFAGLITSLNLNAEQNYIVIAESFDTSFINNCLNHFSITGKYILPVFLPSFGNDRSHILQDLVAFTGSPIHAVSLLTKHNSINATFGTLKCVKQRVDQTILTALENESLKNRIDTLTASLTSIVNPDLSLRIKARIANLKQSRCILYLNGDIEAAQGERFDRAEDAVGAVKAAQGGVIPGAGCTLFMASKIASEKGANGYLSLALTKPFHKILENRGISEADYNKVMDYVDQGFVIDTVSLVPSIALESGILDPANVLKAVVKYSFSAALQILTTGCALQPNFILRD